MNKISKKHARNAGFTLIEVMVAICVLAIAMVGIYNLFTKNMKAHVSQELTLELTQDLRAVLNLMTTEIRMAGYDPMNAGGIGFLEDTENDPDDGRYNTDANSIRFTMDTGDGAGGIPNGSVDFGEDINYYVENGNLTRRVFDSGGATQVAVAAGNISNLTFTYLDENNDITWILADIRTVKISLTGQTSSIDPMLKRIKTRTETALIKIRNLGLSSS